MDFRAGLAETLAGLNTRVVLAALGGASARNVPSIPGVEVLPSEFKLEWMEDPWKTWNNRGGGCWVGRGVRAGRGAPEFLSGMGRCRFQRRWS